MPYTPKLGPKLIVGYCFIQTCLNIIYATFPTMRLLVYKDTLKMPLATMSWMITGAKTLDVLTGFAIGKLSDATRSRFGRRKPFITVFWPLGAVVMFLFLSAGTFFGGTQSAAPCSTMAPLATGNETCAALRACIDAHMANGTLLAYDAASVPVSSGTGVGVSVFFFILYSLYFTTVVSGSQIPYDSLGQELTSDYDERTKLFLWKPIFQQIGSVIGVLAILPIGTSMFPSNYANASQVNILITAVFMGIGYALLMGLVKERREGEAATTAEKDPPLATSVLRLFNNTPYRTYLLMRMPMTVLGLLPYQTVLYYIQNNMQDEQAASFFSSVGTFAIGGAILSIPVMVFGSKKFGRQATLTVTLCVLSTVFLISTFLPYKSIPFVLRIVGIFLGVCLALPYTIPDAMLGDVIDYDELLTGERNEAMYSMVETNLQQGVEILLSMSTLFMSVAGFQNLGGCECGCGASCKDAMGYDHARWVCPNSVGYSCDVGANKIGGIGSSSVLLYQPEPSIIPCTEQNGRVQWVTAIFCFGLPGLCGLLAIYPLRKAVISKEAHTRILEGIEALRDDPSAKVTDPITGRLVVRPDRSEQGVFSEQFTSYERTMAQASGGQGHALTQYLTVRIGTYSAVLLVLIIVNAIARNSYLIQVSFWVLAVLIIAGPLDVSRLRALKAAPPGGILPPGPAASGGGVELTKPDDITTATE